MMLKTSTIAFLEQLALNNNKPWFDANRDKYLDAKEDYEIFVGGVLNALAENEPLFKEQKAKDCIFRIFRDVRFAKDKSPYKPNFGAFFSKGGRKYPGAGYYMHLEPGGNSFVGGGLWMPEAPLLKAVRQEIDYNLPDFKTIVDNPGFKTTFGEVKGESLKNLPSGYTADNPAAEYMKLKSFTLMHNLKDPDLTSPALQTNTVSIFNTMKPFIDFLNNAIA